MSNHWKFLLMLFPIIGNAQIATYDSRTEAKPDWRPVVDLADRDRLTNPDFAPWMLQWATPALIDRETKIAVRITGTVAQAQAQLNAAITNQLPAISRDRDNDVRDVSRGVRSAAASANSVPALRDQVARLAELVEQLQERVEMLEQRE